MKEVDPLFLQRDISIHSFLMDGNSRSWLGDIKSTFLEASSYLESQLKELNNPPTSDSPNTRGTSNFERRIKLFDRALDVSEIDIAYARRLAAEGIPDGKGLRAGYWKLLLYYLPSTTADWHHHLKQKRSSYRELGLQLNVDRISSADMACDENMEDPLSSSPSMDFIKDKALYKEIDKDIIRTHAQISFFAQPCSHGTKLGELRHQVLTRILFIYAKSHPRISYMQGMNEILAPLYFVFSRDPDPDSTENAEADSYFCFCQLMQELSPRFMNSVSEEHCMRTFLGDFGKLFKVLDGELYMYLNHIGITPMYYAYRWLTLLMSQEFELPDVLRLWDSLLADPERFRFLDYFACSMLIHKRSYLLSHGFQECMECLQHYQTADIHEIIQLAMELRHRHRQKHSIH